MMLCKPAIDRASNKKKKKRKYKTNKRALLAKVKQCLVKLFFDIKNLGKTIEAIINIVSKESVPIRKGRKYLRGKTLKFKLNPIWSMCQLFKVYFNDVGTYGGYAE